MNKKGKLMDLFIWIIISFVIILFLAVWMFGHNLLTRELLDIGSFSTADGSVINISDAAAQTFGKVDAATGNLRFFAFVVIFALGFSILITNFFTRSHPVLFIVYVLITVVAIVLSVVISNTYETLMGDNLLGGTLTSFTGASWIMLNLPLWTAVLGIVGAAILFININRDRDLGGGGI